jgi:hypothetical protein
MITSYAEARDAAAAVIPPKAAPPVVITDVLWGSRRDPSDEHTYIYGRLVRHIEGGGVEPVGRVALFFLPASRYTAWVKSYALNAMMSGQPGKIDSRIRPYLQKTLTASDGKFAFTELPVGPGYLFAAVDLEFDASGAIEIRTPGIDASGNTTVVATPGLSYRHRAALLYSYTVYDPKTADYDEETVVDPKAAPIVAAAGDDLHITTFFTLSSLPEPTPASLAPYNRPGDGALTGRLSITLPGGTADPHPCTDVLVVPALPYFHAWTQRYAEEVSRHYTGHSELAPSLMRYSRRVKCDSEGHYTVTGLPAARYIVLAFAYGSVSGGVTLYENQAVHHEVTHVEVNTETGAETVTERHSYDATERVATGQLNYAKCTQQAMFASVVRVIEGQSTETGLAMMGSSFDGYGCPIIVADP